MSSSERPSKPALISDLEELQPQLVSKLVIPHPGKLPPEAETNVPCPVCQMGMVPASVAAKIRLLLRSCAEPPPEEQKEPA